MNHSINETAIVIEKIQELHLVVVSSILVMNRFKPLFCWQRRGRKV